MKLIDKCPICNGSNFYFNDKILSRELINDWQISGDEVAYISYQQGFGCANCNVNLRSMTLASSIMNCFNFSNMKDFINLFEKSVL